MILVDFHNQMNILFSRAVKAVFPEKYKNIGKLGKLPEPTEEELFDLKRAFVYDMVNTHKELKDRYGQTYGNLIVCVDSSNNWKKLILPSYKENRKEKKDKQTPWDKYLSKLMFEYADVVMEILERSGYYVFRDLYIEYNGKKYGLEGDDIIGVLAQDVEQVIYKNLIISNDGDYKQLSSDQTRIYDVNERKVKPPLLKQLKTEFIIKSILKGVAKDNIPSIKHETILHEEFVKWFNKTNDEGLEISQTDLQYLDTFLKPYAEKWVKVKQDKHDKEILEGKRKLQKKWSVYQPPLFGDKAVDEFYNDMDNLLKSYEPWQKNYERNKKLFLFEEIPTRVRKLVLDKYDSLGKSKESYKDSIQRKHILKTFLFENGLRDVAELI